MERRRSRRGRGDPMAATRPTREGGGTSVRSEQVWCVRGGRGGAERADESGSVRRRQATYQPSRRRRRGFAVWGVACAYVKRGLHGGGRGRREGMGWEGRWSGFVALRAVESAPTQRWGDDAQHCQAGRRGERGARGGRNNLHTAHSRVRQWRVLVGGSCAWLLLCHGHFRLVALSLPSLLPPLPAVLCARLSGCALLCVDLLSLLCVCVVQFCALLVVFVFVV